MNGRKALLQGNETGSGGGKEVLLCKIRGEIRVINHCWKKEQKIVIRNPNLQQAFVRGEGRRGGNFMQAGSLFNERDTFVIKNI